MPYSPTTWVEGVTKLGPTNMNKIETGIVAAIPADIVDAKGDLIVGSAADTVIRKAVGADNTALVAEAAQAGGVKWLDLTTLLLALATYDAKGDLIVGTADNAAARMAVGSVGQVIVPDSAQTVGMKWAQGGVTTLFDSTLGAPAASFDITAIPANYSALRLALYLRGDTAAASTTALFRANGDAGANYDRQRHSAAAAAATIAEQFAQTSAIIADVVPANTATANVFGIIYIDIPFYAGTANNKVIDANSANKIGVATTNLVTGKVAAFWRSNAAINQLTILPGAGNWNTGSRAILWGIG